MSWWTGFRDAALIGAGLKKGRTAAKTLAGAARPRFKAAVTPAPAVQPQPQQAAKTNNKSLGAFSFGSYVRNNKWLAAVFIAGGGFLLYKGVNK